MKKEDSIRPVTADNLGDFKKLLVCLFPLAYPPSFFRQVLDSSGSTKAFMAYSESPASVLVRPVACVSWRGTSDGVELLTLGVLPLHRERGLGSRLLKFMLEETDKDGVSLIKLHVHSTNEAAKKFYQKRGFSEVGVKETYYRRLDPPSAVEMTLRREINEDLQG